MGHSKQNKSQAKKVDGKYRQETREERRLRLQQQEEAQEKCMKLLPIAGGVVLVLVVLFALYVRSVPVKAVPRASILPEGVETHPDFQNIMAENPNVKVEIREILPDPPAESGEAAETTGGDGPMHADESIEL